MATPNDLPETPPSAWSSPTRGGRSTRPRILDFEAAILSNVPSSEGAGQTQPTRQQSNDEAPPSPSLASLNPYEDDIEAAFLNLPASFLEPDARSPVSRAHRLQRFEAALAGEEVEALAIDSPGSLEDPVELGAASSSAIPDPPHAADEFVEGDADLPQMIASELQQLEAFLNSRSPLDSHSPAKRQRQWLINDTTFRCLSSSSTDIPAGQDCAICYEPFSDTALTLPCAEHGCLSFFHSDCIRPWFERNPTCPLCRRSFQELVKPARPPSASLLGDEPSPLVESLLLELEEESRPWLRRARPASATSITMHVESIGPTPASSSAGVVANSLSAAASAGPATRERSHVEATQRNTDAMPLVTPPRQTFGSSPPPPTSGPPGASMQLRGAWIGRWRSSLTASPIPSGPSSAVTAAPSVSDVLSGNVSSASVGVTSNESLRRQGGARPLAGGGWARRGEWGQSFARRSLSQPRLAE